MAAVTEQPKLSPSQDPWGSLPLCMRVLHITSSDAGSSWLAESFASDSASQVQLEKAIGVMTGLARLRNERFDALLIDHKPALIDALELVDGIRASNPDQAIIILGLQSEQEMAALCYEVGSDGYICINTATTRALIWTVSRAIERHRLIAENRRFRQAGQHRLQQEHHEVDRLLDQQRVLIAGLEEIRQSDQPPAATAQTSENGSASRQLAGAADSAARLPRQLVSHYRELLRTYVIMGSGSLAEEMRTLAELLATAGVTAQQAMLLHLKVLEELIRDLGNRSARHVMNRADLLIVEVMVHLAERYRLRYHERIHPPRQLMLPGVE